MPAASETPVPSLPHTFRPLGVRISAYVLAVVLFGTAATVWLAFGPDTRDQFTLAQRSTVVLVGVVVAVIVHGLGRSRVETRVRGIRVVNGYRTHRYDWNQVLAISLRPGSPWAVLDLSDGTTASALGIQGSDGRRAARQVRQLRMLVDQQTGTDPNG